MKCVSREVAFHPKNNAAGRWTFYIHGATVGYTLLLIGGDLMPPISQIQDAINFEDPNINYYDAYKLKTLYEITST